MKLHHLAACVALGAGLGAAAEPTRITDEASAVAAARKYTRARCTERSPCEYRARREGRQWNVMVEFSKRSQPGEVSQRHPGGHLLLYFNEQGQLVRRVEGE
jgi:hypothetical protein